MKNFMVCYTYTFGCDIFECSTKDDMDSVGLNLPVDFFGLKLSCITIGMNCSVEDTQELVNIGHELNVRVRKAKPSKDKYIMEYDEL